MVVTINARGTTESSFTLGKQGIKIKNNSSVLEFRNSSDTAYINFQSLGIDDNASETVITIDVDENVQMYRDQGDATEVLTLIQDNAGATGDVIAIGNDGTGDAIEIVNTGNARGIYIDTSASSANAIEILNQFVVGSISTPANYIKIIAATAGNSPILSVEGSDTNADLTILPKGTGNIILGDTSGTGTVFLMNDAATSSNNDGVTFQVQTGNGDGTGDGGSITLLAGDGGALGDGGDIVLDPGLKGASGTNDGKVIVNGKLKLKVYTVATTPTGVAGDTVYISDGDTGSPCLAVHNGTDWKVVALGVTISAT